MTFSGSRARSGLSCSFPRFCTTEIPFRREHARPERQGPVRPVCPVGLYRAHIRIGLVALPQALPRRGGVRPVVRARRFHGRNGPRSVAREPLERAIEEPARRLRAPQHTPRPNPARPTTHPPRPQTRHPHHSPPPLRPPPPQTAPHPK